MMKPAGFFLACRLCLFCLGALFHSSGAFAATDDEIIAHFKKEGARLRAEIAAERTDIARVHALQLEMKALLERTLAQVGEPLRSVLRITYQIVNPIMEESIAYNALVQAKVESGVFDHPTATSTEIVEQRLKEIGELETGNAAFAKRLDSFDADMEKALNESRLKSNDRQDLLERFRKQLGSRMAAMRATRTLEAAMYVEMRGIYGLQKEYLGKWSVKEGRLVFHEKAQMEAFERHTSRLIELEARQDKARDVARKISPAPAH